MLRSLVGSEMCIRDRISGWLDKSCKDETFLQFWSQRHVTVREDCTVVYCKSLYEENDKTAGRARVLAVALDNADTLTFLCERGRRLVFRSADREPTLVEWYEFLTKHIRETTVRSTNIEDVREEQEASERIRERSAEKHRNQLEKMQHQLQIKAAADREIAEQGYLYVHDPDEDLTVTDASDDLSLIHI
eukprot:TRINITY_DN3862_c0_g1_i2.p1 TRINITY_DN3862_c0_g1~~TRINITY_DN3862_c0_g1_i2.p1  ORF type:complete len:190 (+),score=53.84 TRINITY_DN3862_c0_g1_i2:103-672(+)